LVSIGGGEERAAPAGPPDGGCAPQQTSVVIQFSPEGCRTVLKKLSFLASFCQIRSFSRTPGPPPFSSMNSIREGGVGLRYELFLAQTRHLREAAKV
jgi:hypothetical protein